MIPLVKHTIFICWWLKIAVTATASLQGNLLFTSSDHEHGYLNNGFAKHLNLS